MVFQFHAERVGVQRLSDARWISRECLVAKGFFQRLKGLIGCKALHPEESMLFPYCSEIHMWFMSISIDVIFLKPHLSASGEPVRGQWIISSIFKNVRPWRLLPLSDRTAHTTLEIPAGMADHHHLEPGDVLCLS